MRILTYDGNLFPCPATHICSLNLLRQEVLTYLQPVRLATRFMGSVYLGLDDAKDEIVRLEELENARKEINSIERNTMRSMESQFKYI